MTEDEEPISVILLPQFMTKYIIQTKPVYGCLISDPVYLHSKMIRSSTIFCSKEFDWSANKFSFWG
jgi:hypothetical protein